MYALFGTGVVSIDDRGVVPLPAGLSEKSISSHDIIF
jgi:hypothetical protein